MSARPRRDERGTVLVVTAVFITVVLGIAALVIDVAQLRTSRRSDQTIADFAALAAGRQLGVNNPTKACQDAIIYINANLKLPTSISPSGFCSQSGNSVSQTTCSKKTLAQARPTVTQGDYTVTIHYPVTNGEIADANVTGGARVNDGTACQRMRVLVTKNDTMLFGGVLGATQRSTTISATVRPSMMTSPFTPALWLLDPTGCTSLAISGGSQVTVGVTSPSVIPGVLTIDSDGSTCSTGSQQVTISVGGSGTLLRAVPVSGSNMGSINLMALPLGTVVCVLPACDPADVSSSRMLPQPIAQTTRSTRAPVDWRYNCKTGYPDFHGIPITDCPSADSTPPYIDNLRAAVGTTGSPNATYQRWKQSHSCNVPSGSTVVSGNWWIDCSNLAIGNGTSLTFSGGNVVFDGGVNMTGGSLTFNGANPSTGLPTSCLPPTVVTPCIDKSSNKAGLVYLRAGDLNVTGGTFTVNQSMVYLHSGYVKVAGGAPPVWSAPSEGPFAYLGLWSELSSNKYQINGGAGVSLSGVFFVPEANPFSLAGGGNWGQQRAQFIAYHMTVTGGGILTMAPDPTNFIRPPIRVGALIR